MERFAFVLSHGFVFRKSDRVFEPQREQRKRSNFGLFTNLRNTLLPPRIVGRWCCYKTVYRKPRRYVKPLGTKKCMAGFSHFSAFNENQPGMYGDVVC